MKMVLAAAASVWFVTPANADPVTHVDSKFHFSLSYPSEWTVEDLHGWNYRVTNPESKMACQVLVQNLLGPSQPDVAVRAALESWSDTNWHALLASTQVNVNIRERSRDHLSDGWPANRILFRSNDDIGDVVFYRMEHYLMTARNGRLYTADCYIEEHDEAKLEGLWNRWGAEAASVIKSFNVTAE